MGVSTIKKTLKEKNNQKLKQSNCIPPSDMYLYIYYLMKKIKISLEQIIHNKN